MTLSEKLAIVMDAIRNQYGTEDKYTLDQVAKGIDALQAQNLFVPGQSYDSSSGQQNEKNVSLVFKDWNLLIGKDVTLSYDLEWSGYKSTTESRNRIGIEFGLYANDGISIWLSSWCYPSTTSGKKRVSFTMHIPDKKIVRVEEGNFFNQVNPECRVKATNWKMVVNPMGSAK